jgi:hypothetical protein
LGIFLPGEARARCTAGKRCAEQVDTVPVVAADGVLRVDLVPYPGGADAVVGYRPPLTPHWASHLRPVSPTDEGSGLGTRCCELDAQSSDVLSTDALGRPAALLLDRLMTEYPACVVASVADERRCLVALRTSSFHADLPSGYQFELTVPPSDEVPPAPLYASGVYGWAVWWIWEASRVLERQRLWPDLPPPPSRLAIGHAGRVRQLAVDEVYRTQWPLPPRRRTAEWWDDVLD